MYQDPEINALSNAYEALKGLDHWAIKRIVAWVIDKFGLEKPGAEIAQPEITEVEPVQPVEAGVEVSEPVKKPRGRKPKEAKPTEVKAIEEKADFGAVSTVVSTRRTGLMKYETLEEVFKAVSIKGVPKKVLVASAFLQECKNYKELSSYDISSQLKDIGQPVKGASLAITSLITRKPPLLVQVGTFGATDKARRKFRVTEEGLKTARGFLKD